MRLTDFLHKNVTWNLHKNAFADLCAQPTAETQLLDQLRKLNDKYYPQRQTVETAYTEFCLNEIALATPKTEAQKIVKENFERYWQTYLRARNNFCKKYMLFPSDGKKTRIEQIAELVAKCTQFAVDGKTMDGILNKAREICDLEERESRNLFAAVDLARVNFYCAVAKSVLKNSVSGEMRLAKMLDRQILNADFAKNSKLIQVQYASEKLATCVDCLGNSAAKFLQPTFLELRPYFYIGGRNVFDTFCNCKLGERTAEFASQSATLSVKMQYFLQNNCEVRRFTLRNLGKGKKTLITDFLFENGNSSAKTEYFETNGSLCLAVVGDNEFYAAAAVVCDDKILPCQFEEGRLSAKFVLNKDGIVKFDVVTVYAENMPELADGLERLNVYGGTRCPYLTDAPAAHIWDCKIPLQLNFSYGCNKRTNPSRRATTLNYTYQLGNGDVGTFLDNAGNCTTLLSGFAFGVRGEKAYSVKNGILTQLNRDKFQLENDTVVYRKENGAICKILHGETKEYFVEYPSPAKTLFYFPLEEKCKVTLRDNAFTLIGKTRKIEIICNGEVESFTTNAVECNSSRLRYKLSGDLEAGSCLAICFATADNANLKIVSLSKTPAPCPLVRESLVSTYLNYVNEKNAFCLNNYLKRADSLTLAAINFTNPKFVKRYLEETLDKTVFYYDVAGQKKEFFDKLALPLATVYYASLTTDAAFPTEETKKYVNGILFGESFSGRDLCVKALALKRAAQISGFDKVRCLIEYNNVKSIIVKDAKLYSYAQAIGAVPMVNPSKERLKDLCNKFEIPKSWYYVSQLENLYGLTLVEGKLNFAPKVTQENVLEQLALNVDGKRIDTTFAKSTVQSMTLNGTQYFLPFRPQMLKNENNTLVVRY
ncbi:MAG: hypothetical protein NC132_01935 [Corallococcus sp.]|nr:hypothetical protein [Corallococcus sp.]MCM1359418.1 hypothetical protein [Corallococcus sp.]MCM1394861.1 hypothetical protein [Corallococcus sp.]